MNVSDLKIGTRLAIGFGALAVIALLLGGMGSFGIHTLSASMENFTTNRIPGMLLLSQLNRERMTIRAQTLAILAHETQADAHEHAHAIEAERQKSWQTVDRAWAEFVKLPRASERGRALVEQVDREYRAWRAIYVELDDLIARLADAADADQRRELYAQYRATVSRMVPLSDAMGKSFDILTEQNLRATSYVLIQQCRTTWAFDS